MGEFLCSAHWVLYHRSHTAGYGCILYGCVETSWKRLSELSTATASIPVTQGITQNVNGVVYVRETNNDVRQLNNIGFTPIALTGHTHEVGKIIYDNIRKHFYQGVSGGLWHQIDNEVILVDYVEVHWKKHCSGSSSPPNSVDCYGYGRFSFRPPIEEGSMAYQIGLDDAIAQAQDNAGGCGVGCDDGELVSIENFYMP